MNRYALIAIVSSLLVLGCTRVPVGDAEAKPAKPSVALEPVVAPVTTTTAQEAEQKCEQELIDSSGPYVESEREEFAAECKKAWPQE